MDGKCIFVTRISNTCDHSQSQKRACTDIIATLSGWPFFSGGLSTFCNPRVDDPGLVAFTCVMTYFCTTPLSPLSAVHHSPRSTPNLARCLTSLSLCAQPHRQWLSADIKALPKIETHQHLLCTAPHCSPLTVRIPHSVFASTLLIPTSHVISISTQTNAGHPIQSLSIFASTICEPIIIHLHPLPVSSTLRFFLIHCILAQVHILFLC